MPTEIPAKRKSKVRKVALSGVALAERLTRYFPPADKIETFLDCDIEIRRMADDLLADAKGLK